MRCFCILVTSNVLKCKKKCNQLVFLANTYCNIEHFSRIGLTFFLCFSCIFTCILDTSMLVSKQRVKTRGQYEKKIKIKNANEKQRIVSLIADKVDYSLYRNANCLTTVSIHSMRQQAAYSNKNGQKCL